MPGGLVVGALPNARAGISGFESDMEARGFESKEIRVDTATQQRAQACIIQQGESGVVVPEDVAVYRLVLWRRTKANEIAAR